MKPTRKARALSLLGAPLVLAVAACEPSGPNSMLVARAAGHELTVGETVSLLAPRRELPSQPELVQAFAELWTDYTLLATAAVRDSTLSNIAVDPLVQLQVEQELIMALRDSVIQVDTAISQEELVRRFEQEAPGVRVRARHILLTYPEQATQADRDSVGQVARNLLGRIQAGEGFEELAQQYSQDPGTAPQGGDLGFFGRGEMVPPFEEAAFALAAGEVSDVVESPYGLHIIRVDEKETPSLADVETRFRSSLQQERTITAESIYVSGVEERAEVEVAEGGQELVREIAQNPQVRLAGRAARRPVVSYRDGAYTVDELRQFIQTRPPQYRQQLSAATDEQVENLVRSLAQRELLVAEARRQGVGFPAERIDSLRGEARQQLVQVARNIGFTEIAPEPGESEAGAVERTVEALLQEILQGEVEVVPLGGVSFALREELGAEVYDSGIQRAVEEIQRVRGPELEPSGGPTPPTGEPPAPSDSLPDTQEPPATGTPGEPPPGGQEPR